MFQHFVSDCFYTCYSWTVHFSIPCWNLKIYIISSVRIIYIRVYFRVYVPLVYLLFLFNFLSLLALTTLAQCMHIRICSFIHVNFFVQFCVSLLVCSFLFVSFRFKPCATRFHPFLIICSLFLQMILQTVCYSFPPLSNHLQFVSTDDSSNRVLLVSTPF